MDAGTRESELARTRALLRLTSAFLKRAGSAEQRQVALSRIDSLLERYHRLISKET